VGIAPPYALKLQIPQRGERLREYSRSAENTCLEEVSRAELAGEWYVPKWYMFQN